MLVARCEHSRHFNSESRGSLPRVSEKQRPEGSVDVPRARHGSASPRLLITSPDIQTEVTSLLLLMAPGVNCNWEGMSAREWWKQLGLGHKAESLRGEASAFSTEAKSPEATGRNASHPRQDQRHSGIPLLRFLDTPVRSPPSWGPGCGTNSQFF